MAESQKTPRKKTTRRTATKSDLGASEVAEKVKKETDQGFRGAEVDPTPNENYTVKGVTSGKPTPETDDKASADARAASGR